ncbi:hypothetical protein F5883DRAFT_7933 [Diaporthe sp. PMI_573]|nr:hypothetical protein F5883DRAFT_7933 [Diaporthaceae sp. PMI_573]
MFGSNFLHCGLDCVTQDRIDICFFVLSCISILCLIFDATRLGCRDKRTTVWLVVAFIQSLFLFHRASQQDLELARKQRLLFLWAAEVFCCYVVFLWSFQDPPAVRTDPLRQPEVKGLLQ